MKQKFSILWPVLAATLFAVTLASSPAQTNRLNGVAAIVNDAIITEQEVYSELEKMLPQLQFQYRSQPARLREELSRRRVAILEGLIERQLVLADFKAAGFNIPETLIEDQFQQDVVSKFGDRVAFVQTLQKEGKTIEDARKEFRDYLIVYMMSQQKIRNQVTISPFKIERYYAANQDKFAVEDQVKLRMIILPMQTAGDATVIERGKSIHQQIVNGTPFEEMARQHSVGAQAKDGGMMGWNGRKELRKELIETAFTLKPGAVSEPIVTDDAIFILKVEEAKAAQVRPLADVRDEIEQALQAEESAQRRKQWIDTIRQKAFVRLF
jgi:peptidyl-prolyl cis-trans isomerase SurA